MSEIALLEQALSGFAGISSKEFERSLPFWERKEYRKGEFYNEYRNVCKHLGFILNGVFRTYHVHEATGEEKNLLFYTSGQILVSYKSFLEQKPCNYYTESMVPSTILYIHIDHLRQLYRESHEWERFGRIVAEMAFSMVMNHTEDFLFKSPEQRYIQMMEKHPDLFNAIPLYHISSYLGIQGPSLSRIRKRMLERKKS